MMFSGCTSSPEEFLTGEWQMHKVIQDGQEVTSEHDPFDERFLIIKDDNTFESGGRPYGKNTGKYEFNITEHTLFLDSDSGPEDDSNWRVTFQGDTMFWQGYGAEWAEAFELIHIKE
jgi:hypothetical protein